MLAREKDTQTISKLFQILIILFENVKQETSIYYLFSNNYANRIIEFGSILYTDWRSMRDGSVEECRAYYASYLKTLSLKLNESTIPFFFNEVSV